MLNDVHQKVFGVAFIYLYYHIYSVVDFIFSKHALLVKNTKIYKNIYKIKPLFVPTRMNKFLTIQIKGGFQLTLEFYVKLVKS